MSAMAVFLATAPDGMLTYVDGAPHPTCPHPVEDHAPLSGDEWCCGHCGQLVEHPSPPIGAGKEGAP